MFADLYDAVSLIFSSRWPRVDGVITAVDVERISHGKNADSWRLAVAYQFCIGDDGPYTGESFWNPHYGSKRTVIAAIRKMRTRQPVTIRYRKDDPSVNRLDRAVWARLKASS